MINFLKIFIDRKYLTSRRTIMPKKTTKKRKKTTARKKKAGTRKKITRKPKRKTAKRKTAKRKAPKRKTAKTKRKASKKTSRKSKKQVTAIPKGYHSITPYLIINDASNAIEFYKKAFGAKVVMKMEQPSGKISHAELKIGDAKIMLADEHPERDARSPQSYGGTPVGIHLYIKNVDSIVDKALSNGARLISPVQNMFYGDRSGTLEDPYGHKWFVSTHIENVSANQMKKRAAELAGKKPL